MSNLETIRKNEVTFDEASERKGPYIPPNCFAGLVEIKFSLVGSLFRFAQILCSQGVFSANKAILTHSHTMV